jgi:hypothetical protein
VGFEPTLMDPKSTALPGLATPQFNKLYPILTPCTSYYIILYYLNKPRAGLEPAAFGLGIQRSTNWANEDKEKNLMGAMGLEPITRKGLDLQSNALAISATLPMAKGGIEPP